MDRVTAAGAAWLAALLVTGCGGGELATPDELNESYRAALARSLPAAHDFAGDEAGEAAALARLAGFFRDMSVDSVRRDARSVYADEAYLNDNLAAVRGAAAIEDYFAAAAARADRVSIVFEDVARSGPEFYVRWEMSIESRRLNGGRPMRSLGVSHFRLDRDGRVLLHKDFWDAGTGIYEYLPVVGALLRAVRGRLAH